MIRFQLRCERGDSFEAWFRGNADFDEQIATQQILCPFCGSTAVEKALMAPALVSSGARKAEPSPPAKTEPAEKPETVRLATGPDPDIAKAMELMREMSRQVRASSDYVGPRFAEEARKIHYSEVPPRSIYGEATADDVKDLADEGIGFHPLPILPEERN